MKISEANQELLDVLSKQYEQREREQISKIFWEDIFGYRGGLDRNLQTRETVVFRDAITKLNQGFPIQYVTGISYFYNLKLEVDPSVLIPRPETEELVFQILSDGVGVGDKVLDIGTGSGCIAITIKSRKPHAEVTAIDASQGALEVAARNAERNEVIVDMKVVDFLDVRTWSSLEAYDIIVSNPPYISLSEKDKMSASTLRYEPDMALYPVGEDVLIFYRRIAEFGKKHLKPGGRIYLECNEFNANAAAEIYRALGYGRVELIQDMQGKDRILVVSP